MNDAVLFILGMLTGAVLVAIGTALAIWRDRQR